MKGYQSIPSVTTADEEHLSASVKSSNHEKSSSLGAKFAVVTGTLLLLVAAFAFSSNSHESFGSLRSASVVVLPNPPDQPPLPADKIYNDNPHVKYKLFTKQRVNHFPDDNYKDMEETGTPKYWTQPYFQTTQYWKGPGYPIFCIIGGEAVQEKGFIYPFVSVDLAQHFGAAVIQPEHRFYGVKKPVENATKTELLELLTVPQALADVAAFTRFVAQDLGCNTHDKTSKHYCPIITVGGSYAAFLAAMSRIVYPDFIDAAYSSSGPILMYGQLVEDPNIYYDIMTKAYDHASPGCAAAIKHNLYAMTDKIVQVYEKTGSLSMAAESVGVCGDAERLPAYLKTPQALADAIVEVASSRFHDAGLFSYPPGPDTGMSKICRIFQTHEDPIKDFLFTLLDSPFIWGNPMFGTDVAPPQCFDFSTQVPKDGLSVEDTPDDINHDGIVWDFSVCTDLVFIFGYSEKSMLPPKEATYEELYDRCRKRFGVTPRPWELVDKYDFGDLTTHSNILFTNGMQDCWAGGGVTWNVSDTVLSLYFPNGAHHSDLTRGGPIPEDTDDIKYGYIQIKNILGKWIDDVGK